LVDSDPSQYAHKFSALLTQQAYVAIEIQKLADSHFSGALAPMVMTLFQHGKLGPKERKRIRQIIEGME
jgi:predicted transcriptional regulator